jgi:putative endopeptidase
MKKFVILAGCALALFTASKPAPSTEQTSGIDRANMDMTTSPADDFYQYACGGWMQKHPLTAEYARYGSFDKLAEENQAKLKDLITGLAKQQNATGSIPDKIATLYRLGMDSVKLQQQGGAPIRPLLATIAKLSTKKDLQGELITLHKNGIFPFFELATEADYTNSKMSIAWLYQGGTGMGERSYYLDNDDRTKDIRAKYQEMMTKLFDLSGYAKLVKIPASKLTTEVMGLETELAKAAFDRVTLRDPHKNFNKMEIAKLVEMTPDVDFATYFKSIGLPNLKSLNVAQPEFIKAVQNIFKSTKPEAVKAYFAWYLINTAAPYLSNDFVTTNFAFYGKAMSGREVMRPRWKRVVTTINGTLGEAVGQMYVEKYFPPAAKKRMLELVHNLQDAFAQRIQASEWMAQETKNTALAKLKSIHVKIGYPDKWRDYSKLPIVADSYFANILRSNQFDLAYMLNKVDKPTDVNEWLMTPQTVNAYYQPTTNEICFPAAILQPPFFNQQADDAANYGAIGVVIGHEMTHGFDDEGRQYDLTGNLKDWWQPEDSKKFDERANVLVDYFNNIEVVSGTKANGKLTLGENLADNGGLHISYVAMQNAIKKGDVSPNPMDGFTPAQRFFLAYAGVWASNTRDQEKVRLTKTDPHSLAQWRVNGTLPHIEMFIDAFNVKAGSKMYLPKEKQALIW